MIETLRGQHKTEIESLQEDMRNLVELVWCLIHRVSTHTLSHGIDERHTAMASALANKYGVTLLGIA